MTKNLAKMFKSYDRIDFEKIENPLNKRSDLCAFLFLDQLIPGGFNIVNDAEHDQIWLSIDCEKLSEVATEKDIIILKACGVWYDSSREMLSMFV